ncbi:MAG: hypothetical protein DRJ65_04170 [Acidobacteria bacterium]|nr:MAG: hypothetical protein DRJ65_04170 [Acidobacteriota bacterium]
MTPQWIERSKPAADAQVHLMLAWIMWAVVGTVLVGFCGGYGWWRPSPSGLSCRPGPARRSLHRSGNGPADLLPARHAGVVALEAGKPLLTPGGTGMRRGNRLKGLISPVTWSGLT